jgi:hypothetical protein
MKRFLSWALTLVFVVICYVTLYSSPSYAFQQSDSDVNKLLNTKQCVKCDLEDADLTNADLRYGISTRSIGFEPNVPNVNISSQETNMATIKITRKSSFLGFLSSKWIIYINGIIIGSISDGETKNIDFVPCDSGNTLFVAVPAQDYVEAGFPPYFLSKPFHFKGYRGDIIPLSCQTNFDFTEPYHYHCFLTKEVKEAPSARKRFVRSRVAFGSVHVRVACPLGTQ